MPAVACTSGIDYSGVQTPTASLKGPRIYLAEGNAAPVEVVPPPSPRKYWTRKGVAERLTPLLPPITPEDIELLCWLGIEVQEEGLAKAP